jgi:hypothetical protein
MTDEAEAILPPLLAVNDVFRFPLKVAPKSYDHCAIAPPDVPFSPPPWRSQQREAIMTTNTLRLDDLRDLRQREVGDGQFMRTTR